MLFIGHFSFDEVDVDGRVKHGYFSSIVDAESPEAAVAKFEAHIKKMKGTHKVMDNVVNVYIEEILRIPRIPETPMITRFQSSRGEFPPSVSHALPGVDSGDAEAFGFTPDVERQRASDGHGFVESKPFITFSG
ncbi:hypothetical protein [Desulfococcus sp.]|uniref:hypothetical protein n=1 Tax=Desulfococcus sp. TaxID=2025834 RepID=UPI0035931DF9